jgi:REase associating with pPIWI_RE
VPSSRAGRKIPDAAGWRVFSDDILAYWVGPGLAEIRLHDALRAAGVDVVLYPRDDAADVGRSDELGIDVKSYSCPRLLGEVLTDRLGSLATFRDRFVAIPDAMVNRRPRYLDDLREAYRGSLPVTFAKVGDILRLVSA